ncbi:hypothetical protein [Synechococcus sp. PCC 7336]|uniref:hypothetical protein n=1 Tax=Synechococcus sp. PCC 7336 TaxID=195250 RepID=UPI0003467A7E|nr:hypothetical protein [Synechococcus sp. PCC 7336]
MPDRQLELDLWGELEAAERLPQQVEVGRLLKGLDAALLPLSAQQRLLLAGEAMGRIVSVWQLRAEGMLLD